MNNKHEQCINIGIYARSATHEQEAPSKCDLQVMRANNYIAEMFFLPRVNISEYRDEFTSRHSPIGAGLGQLLRDTQAHKLDILIIGSADRLSRNFEVNQFVCCVLESSGVKLLTIL